MIWLILSTLALILATLSSGCIPYENTYLHLKGEQNCRRVAVIAALIASTAFLVFRENVALRNQVTYLEATDYNPLSLTNSSIPDPAFCDSVCNFLAILAVTLLLRWLLGIQESFTEGIPHPVVMGIFAAALILLAICVFCLWASLPNPVLALRFLGIMLPSLLLPFIILGCAYWLKRKSKGLPFDNLKL